MSSELMWTLILAIGLSVMILSAGASVPGAFMAMTAFISLTFALLAVRENKSLRAAGKSLNIVAASTARYMGLVWVWGALGLFVTYMFVLPEWKDWWQFFLAFSVAGVLCLFFAATHARDATAGREDQTMLKLGRALAITQLAGTLITMAGLFLDPKKHFLNVSKPEWAANSIFFFGALALAIISAYALYADRAKS